MRVRFRIRLSRGGRKLTKKDLRIGNKAFSTAIRYILEFKYLEATKWLMLSEDTREKFLLLGLIYTALGQEEMAEEFFERFKVCKKTTDLQIFIEFPQKGQSLQIESPEDFKLWHTKGS